jgi:hypothetical protein
MTDKTTPVAVSVFGVKLLFADGTPVTQEQYENEPSQAAIRRKWRCATRACARPASRRDALCPLMAINGHEINDVRFFADYVRYWG